MWREIEGKILGREEGEGHHAGLECRTFSSGRTVLWVLQGVGGPGSLALVSKEQAVGFSSRKPHALPLLPLWAWASSQRWRRLHSLSFLYLERFYFFRLFPSIFKEFFQMRDGGLPTSALTAAGEAGQRELPPRGGLWGRGSQPLRTTNRRLFVTGGGGTLDSGVRWAVPSPLSWCSGGRGTPCV